MCKKMNSLMEHVERNRAKYAAGATAVIALVLLRSQAVQWNEFLKEHNLYDEFYKMED